jgi:hypothetical protein
MKSGYGLEMRAAAVCREHLFHATTQSVPYRDPTEGDTTREADVVVQGGTLYGSDGVFWTLTVVIECKSPKGKPWVALLIPHTVSGSLSGALVEPVSPDRDALERLMDALKDFSPFASASYAEGLVSAHVSDGRDQKNGYNTAGSALRQAMSAAAGIHEQYVPPSEQHITMTLPVLVTGGELYGASLDPTGEVEVEDLSHVFVKAPRPGGQDVADVHVMTFDYFTDSFVPDLRWVLTERIF